MSKRILVVEDQPDNRQIIRDLLAPADYEITEAENGEEALAAVAKQRPDLILMGIQLPIMDGYEVTRRIKANPALRSIPIIAVTSHALDGEEQTARAAGCDDYVPEPYSPRQLLAKIQQVHASISAIDRLHCITPIRLIDTAGVHLVAHPPRSPNVPLRGRPSRFVPWRARPEEYPSITPNSKKLPTTRSRWLR
jgi:two-component system, cell cycle response regulator DivK